MTHQVSTIQIAPVFLKFDARKYILGTYKLFMRKTRPVINIFN